MNKNDDDISQTTTGQWGIDPVMVKGRRAVDYQLPKGALNTPSDRAYGIGGWMPNALGDNTLKVTTRFNKEMIEQSVIAGAGIDIHQQFVKRILNLQDQGVRDALIKLGWTPPPDQ